jgi:hypothetical protein
VSRYSAEACLRRASNILQDWDGGRIIREHQENAEGASDPNEARIAKGFALIARRRRLDDVWRAKQYKRLANGEDIDE